MSKIKKEIEVEVTELKCDFCDIASIYFHGSTTNYNIDVRGFVHIRQCCICNKDICEKHQHIFFGLIC